jgi:hypothetical protein
MAMKVDGPNIMEIYNKWFNTALESISRAGSSNLEVLRNTLLKLTNSSNIYTNLYNIWLPLCQSIQEKGTEAQAYAFDPEAYKEVLNKVFGMASPEKALEVYEQAARTIMAMTSSFTDFMAPWREAFEKNLKALPEFMEGHPEAFLNIFHNLYDALDSTLGRVFHIPAVGKDREKVELALRGIDDLTVYITKSIHFQHILYGAGVEAMQKVLQAYVEKVRTGPNMLTFDEFLNTWVDVNEKEFTELFKTEYFARAQSDMMEAALKVRRDFHKQMELYLYDLPVALRSETKDLYKTVYDLGRRVKSLETELKNYQMKEEARA